MGVPAHITVADHLQYAHNFLGIVLEGRHSREAPEAQEAAQELRGRIEETRVRVLSMDVNGTQFIDLVADTVKFLETDKRLAFFRYGYTGTVHRDGADSRPAPSSPSGEENYCEDAAKRLRAAAVLFIEQIADASESADLEEERKRRIPDLPEEPPEPSAEEQAIEENLRIYPIIGRAFLQFADGHSHRAEQSPSFMDHIRSFERALHNFTKISEASQVEGAYQDVLEAFRVLNLYYCLLWAKMCGSEDVQDVDQQFELYGKVRAYWERLGKGGLSAEEQIELHESYGTFQAIEARLRNWNEEGLINELRRIKEQLEKIELGQVVQANEKLNASAS